MNNPQHWLVMGFFLIAPMVACGGAENSAQAPPPANSTAPPPSAAAPGTAGQAPPPAQPAATPELGTMEVAKAVMVTVELDFEQNVPSIAEALQQIERRYVPENGQGRTFAILDAYGEPTPDGKLHMSMHVSSEKPGLGSLVFKRTGELLWQSRIVQGPTVPPTTKSLGIFIDNGAGRSLIVDGSNNPATILDARIRGDNQFVRDVWPDGAEREVTFVYSACGCPVKAMVRRTGERTARTKDLPVMFPDDPAAVQVISRLMGW